MIDRTKKYWTGDSSEDIEEYLREYSENEHLDYRAVVCHVCGNDALELRVDQNESVIQIKCPLCGTKKILLDCEEYWEDASPRLRKCSVCKTCKHFNVRIGFERRENGDVRWVYEGDRCVNCGTLGSFLNWEINYGPTTDMEQNI